MFVVTIVGFPMNSWELAYWYLFASPFVVAL